MHVFNKGCCNSATFVLFVILGSRPWWKQQQEQLAHASTTHVGCVVVKRERVVHVEFPVCVCVCWDLFGLDDLTASALRAIGFWI